MRFGRVGAGLGLAVFLAACSQAQPPGPPPPAPVTVATPIVKEVREWDEYVGRFVAMDAVDIRPEVSGTVRSVHFEDGQIVQRGALLFTLDTRRFAASADQARASAAQAAAAAAQAQAQATLARSEFARAEALRAAEAISVEEFEQRKAALDQAVAAANAAQATIGATRAAARAAEVDLGFTQIRSPITGRVSDRRLAPGNYAVAGQTVLTTVVSQNPIRFEFIASEGAYLRYNRLNAEGSRPSSRVAANPVYVRLEDEETFSRLGRMDFVDNTVNPRTGTIRGRAIFNNDRGELTPGQFGRMRLLGSGTYQAVLIPDPAINSDQSRKYVLVVDKDNTVQFRPVVPGPMIDGLRVIRSGLSASDRIVIDGTQRAFPGSKVSPQPGKIEAGPSDMPMEASPVAEDKAAAPAAPAPAAKGPEKAAPTPAAKAAAPAPAAKAPAKADAP